jgi:phosphocarrier protein HPr
MSEITLLVQNKTGLHARPAATFVQTARSFSSIIRVKNGDHEVDGKSILGILSLGVNKGTSISISATGGDEKEAVTALKNLIQSNFGEAE